MKQVILVTGGSSGIGMAAAGLLREQGHTVYTLSRRTLTEKHHIACDVTCPAACQKAVEDILLREGKLDVLIHAAGYGISGAGEFTPMEKAEAQLRVNLLGAANMVNACIEPMRKQGGGKILLISSVAAIAPIPFQSWYAASKAALNSYALSMANELRPFRVQLSLLLPGDTATGFTAARDKLCEGDNLYQGRISRSVSKMEQDEQKGDSPRKAAKLLAQCVEKKRLKPVYIIGFSYKLIGLLIRLLPYSLSNSLIYKLYG